MNIYRIKVGAIQTNCYLVYNTPNNVVVIDPGDEEQKIADYVKQNSLTVKAVLLTHGHFDHIGAVAGMKRIFNCPVYISSQDAPRLEKNEPDGTRFGVYIEHVVADYYVNDNDQITIGDLTFKVLHTPGHTQGSVCYQIEDVLFTGDTLFWGDTGRTDLAGGSDEQMYQSILRLKRLSGDYKVYPGHDEATTLENERKYNNLMSRISEK